MDFINNINNNNNQYRNSNKQKDTKNQNEQNYIIETNEFRFKSHLMQSLLSKNSNSAAKRSASKHNNIKNDELKKTIANNNNNVNNSKNKKFSNHVDKLEESRYLNNYNYRYQILHPNRIESDYKNRLTNCNNKNRNSLQIKLKDLIDVNREKIFIDNLYAQFYSDSNIINLVYVSPMDKVPENSVLLDNNFFNSARSSASSSLSGVLGDSFANANVSTNKLLNDFYVNAAIQRNTSMNDNIQASPLLNSEIFLIFLVIFLWLLSVFVCFRKYSLVLCYHKTDVPFYNHNLINVQIHKFSTAKSLSSCATLKALENYPPYNKTSCSIFNSSALDQEILLGSDFSGNAWNGSGDMNRNPSKNSLNNRLLENNSLVTNSTNSIAKKQKYSILSSTDFDIESKKLDMRKKSIMITGYKSMSSRSIDNKLKIPQIKSTKDNHNSFSAIINSYNNNGNGQNTENENPTRKKSRNQSSGSYQAYRLNYDKTGLLSRCKKNSNLLSRLGHNIRPSTLVTLPSSDANSESIEKADVVENFEPLKKERNSLNTKRGFIRGKHFNLMSLDDAALNTYREEHKLNQSQQEKKKNQTLTIPENNLGINLTSRSEKTMPNTPSPSPTSTNEVNVLGEKSVKWSNSRIHKLSPHANFISLRSGGSDSVYNNSWIKYGRSYDIENSDSNEINNSNEIFSSCSLQQSQTLLQPPNTSLSSFHNRSSSPLNGSYVNNSVLSRRVIPSSLRRHMFINSKRNAQTTVDYTANTSPNNEDSVNKDLSSENFVNLETKNETNDSNLLGESINGTNKGEATEKDPNLLNPQWIPLVVRNTLIEMHEEAVASKKSNSKYKIRSTNHLLHSPTKATKLQNASPKSRKNKKKSLSLQNSKEKKEFLSTSTKLINDISNASSNSNFFEELRAKFFQKALLTQKSPLPSYLISNNSNKTEKGIELENLVPNNKTSITSKNSNCITVISNLSSTVDLGLNSETAKLIPNLNENPVQ